MKWMKPTRVSLKKNNHALITRCTDIQRPDASFTTFLRFTLAALNLLHNQRPDLPSQYDEQLVYWHWPLAQVPRPWVIAFHLKTSQVDTNQTKTSPTFGMLTRRTKAWRRLLGRPHASQYTASTKPALCPAFHRLTRTGRTETRIGPNLNSHNTSASLFTVIPGAPSSDSYDRGLDGRLPSSSWWAQPPPAAPAGHQQGIDGARHTGVQ